MTEDSTGGMLDPEQVREAEERIRRRFLAMDVILTYVLWITLLAFLMDLALRRLGRWLFPWTEASL